MKFGETLVKTISFLAFFLQLSFAMADQNFNHIGCVYLHDKDGWHPWQTFYFLDSFDLKNGQSRFLTGAWTNKKPVLPNYAFCTRMIGTTDNNSIVIESYRYKADEFNPIEASDTCSASGTAVELISKNSTTVPRGSFAELEIAWLPPDIDKIKVREYFPLLKEINDLENIAMNKCEELTPKPSN